VGIGRDGGSAVRTTSVTWYKTTPTGMRRWTSRGAKRRNSTVTRRITGLTKPNHKFGWCVCPGRGA